MSKVILEKVCKTYPGDVKAVKDVDLVIKDREFLVLVGPSGCGKSTTLRMIAGLEEVSEGTIRIGDRVVNDIPPKDRDIAMVFQNYALYPHMTVRKNMGFSLKLRRLPKREIDKQVEAAAEILGIMDLLERKPKELSGGQRQRVAVGRAIVRQPQVFLFDEPLSNLDAKLRVEMRTELNKLHKRLDTTMIYVTHDQVEAMTLGDRIVVMYQGEIQQIAEPLTLYDYPVNQFVAGFIGTPPMNFLNGTLRKEDGEFHFDEGGNKIRILPDIVDALDAYVDKPIVFGIRPEDLSHKDADAQQVPWSTIVSTINVVEPLGDEMILYLETGRNKFLSKMDARQKVKIDQELEVSVNLERVHLFDPETGCNLTRTAAKTA